MLQGRTGITFNIMKLASGQNEGDKPAGRTGVHDAFHLNAALAQPGSESLRRGLTSDTKAGTCSATRRPVALGIVR